MGKFTDIASRGGAVRSGLTPMKAGAIAIILALVFVFFAYKKDNPFNNPYELNAYFKNANELKQNAAVRIAGVTIGKVKSVKAAEDGSGLAEVKMQIDKAGLPIKKDADLKIRQRIFLEGNYFVDIHPGTPSAKEMDSGEWIPPDQTASPVQFGAILTALQRDTREDLQTFLKEYSKALEGSGADGFNRAIPFWEPAYRNTAQATRAYLGTEVGDLQKVLSGQGRVFGALSKDENALKGLVTNLNRTAAAFAREDDNLKALVPELRDVLKVGRPALASLNTALPSLRRFARDALPGAISSNRTLDFQIPFIKQARGLVSEPELRGLVSDLRRTIPSLVRLNQNNVRTFEQTRAFSSCTNNVLLPFTKTPIPDPDFPENSGQPQFKVSPRVFVSLASESRLSDANSSYFRVQAGGGPQTIVSTGEAGEELFAQGLFPVDGVRPARPTTRPVFRPDIPCETQEPPDLNAVGGAAGEQNITPNAVKTPANLAREKKAKEEFARVQAHLERVAKGKPSIDPLQYSDLGEKLQAKELGLVKGEKGIYITKAERRREKAVAGAEVGER